MGIVALSYILPGLNREGAKVVGYEGDVVLIVKGPFISTVIEILERTQEKLRAWATRSGLDIAHVPKNLFN